MPATKVYSRVAAEDADDRQALLVGGPDTPSQDDALATGIFEADEDGNVINPAIDEEDPIAVDTDTTPVLAFTNERGWVAFNQETDVQIYIGFSQNMTVNTAAIVVEPGGSWFFAPPRNASYRGNVYVLAADESAGRVIRFQPW